MATVSGAEDASKRHPSRIAVAYDCLFPLTTGGGERQYRAFASDLVRRGIEVEYLTAQHRGEPDTDFDVISVCGPLRLYDDAGVRRFAAAIKFAAALFRHFAANRRRYDAVIVSALPVLNILATRVALVGSGTTVVADYLEVWGRRQWREYAGSAVGSVAWLLQRLAIAMSPVATCHSQLSASRLVAEGLRGAPVVSPGLIDAALEYEVVPVAQEPPFVLYAGRHVQDKRVETLPRALHHARASVPQLRAVILGAGASTPALEEAVDAVDGRGWIELPGFVSQERFDRLMGDAACLVNPSRREGYGLVVVEAAGHGTPVVLVRHEGNASTELVTEGVNGFVAESTEPEVLGDAIVRAVRSGPPLRASARSWFEDAIEKRTIEHTVTGILRAILAARTDTNPAKERT